MHIRLCMLTSTGFVGGRVCLHANPFPFLLLLTLKKHVFKKPEKGRSVVFSQISIC